VEQENLASNFNTEKVMNIYFSDFIFVIINIAYMGSKYSNKVKICIYHTGLSAPVWRASQAAVVDCVINTATGGALHCGRSSVLCCFFIT
jgi:hypothetical protein